MRTRTIQAVVQIKQLNFHTEKKRTSTEQNHFFDVRITKTVFCFIIIVIFIICCFEKKKQILK